MTTFNITNIVPNLQEMTLLVFYEFSNGHVFSNTVPATTPVADILNWGQTKCEWFEERQLQLEELRNQVIEEEI